MAARRRVVDFKSESSQGRDVGEVKTFDQESGIGQIVTQDGKTYRVTDEMYRYPTVGLDGAVVPVEHPEARMELRVGDEVMFRWFLNVGRRCVDWWMLKREHDIFVDALKNGQLFRVVSIDTRRAPTDARHQILLWRGRTLDELINAFKDVRTPADFRWSRGRGRYQYRLERFDRENNRWLNLPREALTDGTLPTYMIGPDELTAEVTAEVARNM